MGRMKPKARDEVVLFNVIYEDGRVTSNRKVPGNLLGSFEGDEPAQAFLEAQDREIAERSGQPRGPIKTIERA